MAQATTYDGAVLSLEGVSTRKGHRHAFVHERVLEFIARDTEQHGSSCFSKRALAEALGCDVKTLDRAITRLKREGVVETVPRFDANGGQLPNAYRAKLS